MTTMDFIPVWMSRRDVDRLDPKQFAKRQEGTNKSLPDVMP
jgi:hypothetical protein